MLSKYDLVCFDMDGTLTRVRSTWKWIHECLGTSNEEGYKAFINQEITEREFMRSDIGTWKKVKPDLCVKDLIGIFQKVPLINGIQETVASLQEAGMKCVIVSGGIDIAAKMIKNEFGFDDFISDALEIDDDGKLTGEGVDIVDLADKSPWVRKFIEKYNTTPERTVSVQVNRAMIDCNDHVHNTAYMDLFSEALPEDEDMDRFDDVTLVYRREIRPGQRIKAAFGGAGEERVVVLSEEDTDQVHAFLLLR